MQENAVSTSDLFNACTVLFGSDVSVSVDFLKYLQMPGLKAAYRKKAFETHPDRATSLAEPAYSLEERFKEVSLAYEQLSSFVEDPWKYVFEDLVPGGVFFHAQSARKGKPRTHASPKTAGQKGHRGNFRDLGEHYWQGSLPGRKLLFGRFLYYSGIISRRILIEAIVWQKRQRPIVGNIAIHWDWLAKEDIRAILQRRKPGERFGECALRCGYISRYQLTILLGRQRMLQPLIGNFFVNRNIINAREMQRFIENLRMHNRQFWRP